MRGRLEAKLDFSGYRYEAFIKGSCESTLVEIDLSEGYRRSNQTHHRA